MGTVTIRFDGAAKAWVEVPNAQWNQARGLVPGPDTDPCTRERMAVAKLLQAGLACTVAADPSYDIGVTIAGQPVLADIKTLYPSFAAREIGTNTAIMEDLWDKIDAEVEKEGRQGCVCLFDLSYLRTDIRQSLVGGIHNSYARMITLEYDDKDAQIHIHAPSLHYESHRGDWYH